MSLTKANTVVTRRALNVPLLVITIIGVTALSAGAYAWYGFQLRRIATSLLTRAESFEQEGDWSQAADYTHRYLQVRPDDVAARIQLAQRFDRSASAAHQKTRAKELYYAALGVAPEAQRLGLRLRLAQLLLETGRFVEAEAEARKILEAEGQQPEAQRILALTLWGQFQTGTLAGELRTEGAVGAAFQQAREAHPRDLELATLWARVLRDEPGLLTEAQREELPTAVDRQGRADTVVDEFVAADPQNAAVRVARYHYRTRYGLAGPEEDIQAALQCGADNPAVLVVAADYFVQKARRARAAPDDVQQSYETAAGYYRRVIELEKSPAVAVYVGLGAVYAAQGKTHEAVETWRQGLERHGANQIALGLPLAEQLLATDRLDEAEEVLGRLDPVAGGVQQTPGALSPASWVGVRDLLRARLLLQRDQPRQAVRLAEAVAADSRSQTGDQRRAWLLLGEAYAALNQWDQAAAAYEQGAELDAAQDEPHRAAGLAWLNAGQPDKAVQQLERALARRDSLDTRLRLAWSRLAAQSSLPPARRNWKPLESELAVLAAWPEQEGLSEPWRLELFQADYALVRAEEAGPLNQEAVERVVSWLRRAEQRIADSASLGPELALRYERMQRQEDADRILARAAELDGDPVRLCLLSARIYTGRKQYDRARQMLRGGLDTIAKDQHWALRVGLMQVSLAEGKSQQAAQELAAIRPADLTDLAAIRQIAERTLDLGTLQHITPWEDRLRQMEGPEGTSWRLVRALRLVGESRRPGDAPLQEAIRLQAEIQRRRPAWAAAYRLQGLIAERQQDPQQALEAYEAAAGLGRRDAATYERLATLLCQAGQFAKAHEYLACLQDQIAASDSLSSLAISVAAGLKDLDRAQTLARQAVDRRPTDPMAWIWLGQVLRSNQDPAGAEQALQQAVAVAPGDVRAWNGLFDFLLGSGRREDARRLLDDLARQTDLPDVERCFIQAQGYEMLGDRNAAETHFRRAAEQAPDRIAIQMRLAEFYRGHDTRQTEASLRRVLELAPGQANSQEVAHNARRILASVLAARGDEGDFNEAMQLLRQAGGDQRTQELNARLQALLLVQRPIPDLDRAEQLLAGLVHQRGTTDDGDRILLARIYAEQSKRLMGPAREAKLAAAGEQYEALCRRSEPQAWHLVLYVDFLLECEDWPTADQALKRLEGLAPNRPESALLRARWLERQGRTAEIPPLLEAFGRGLEKKIPDGEQRARACAALGELCSSLALDAAAAAWYRKAVVLEHGYYAPLASALVRHGKTAEAVQVCLRAANQAGTAQAAVILADILVAGQASEEQLQLAEPVLTRALGDHSQNPDLLLAVANLRVLQNRPREAISFYEAVLRVRPSDAVAMNNLATLLSEEPGGIRAALQYIDEAIRIRGHQPALLDTKGMILVHDRRPADAVPVLRKAVEGPQTDPRHHFHLAVALHRVGDSGEARTVLQTALDNRLTKQVLTPADYRLLEELKKVLAHE